MLTSLRCSLRVCFLTSFSASYMLVLAAPTAPAQCGNETFELLASDGGSHDFLGESVAISGTTAIAGARNHEGIGAAYLYDTLTGLQKFELLSNDREAEDWFGTSVGISGTTAIVGAYGDDDSGNWSGSAYLFDTVTGQQIAKLLPNDGAPGDLFGDSVAISGTIAIVGATFDDALGFDSGSAYLFDTTTGQQIAKLLPADGATKDEFGTSVAISGTTAIVGAWKNDALGTNSGAAYLFDAMTGRRIAKLLPSDGSGGKRFGNSVAISGTTAIVGVAKDNEFGLYTGSAYLFDTVTGERIAKLLASDARASDAFGYSVAMSGSLAIVGAPSQSYRGAAYIFNTTTGQQLAKLMSSDEDWYDQFGVSVAISETTAMAGAEEDDDLASRAGSAYLFSLDSLNPSFCTNTANSTGSKATISACGSNSIADNNFVLTARTVPNQLYLFLQGQNQVEAPFGNGFLCVGGSTVRLNSPMMASGNMASLTLDVPLQIGVPGTTNFQCWFRDPEAGGDGFNFSNGVSVRFGL